LLADDGLSINHDLCSTCTQCIAVCPQQALSWDSVPSVPYDNTQLPTLENLDELFKQRRTIRKFKKAPLERPLLEAIVGYGIYAPTNNYGLRVIIIDDAEVIHELDQIGVKFVAKIYRLIFKPKLIFNMICSITPLITATDKVKMETTLAENRTFHHPPALVFIVGDGRVALSLESAQYALYNMMLYAQVRGIGSCIWGGAQTFIDRSKVARARLGMTKHERILATVGFGYPAQKFKNKVTGKQLNITWI
jgi:nitroreductase